MECIIFTGLQASGKSSFYKERFFSTHIRLSLDMLKTRKRETILLSACIEAKQPFVVDNTNPTAAERARYVEPARAAGFSLVAYYFLPDPRSCVACNARRPVPERVPPIAIWAAFKKLEPPSLSEGFNAMYSVRILPEGGFSVEELKGA